MIFKPLPKSSHSVESIFTSLPTNTINVTAVSELLAEHASLELLKEENAEERADENPPPWQTEVNDDDDSFGKFYRDVNNPSKIW